MPKLIITFTKHKDSDPWILMTNNPNVTPVFTQEELSTIVNPFLAMANAAVGLNTQKLVSTVNGNTYTFEKEFDTLENLQAFMAAVTDETNPLVAAKNKLVDKKYTDLQVERYIAAQYIV